MTIEQMESESCNHYTINMTGKEIKEGTEINISGMTVRFDGIDSGCWGLKLTLDNVTYTFDTICGFPMSDDNEYLVQWKLQLGGMSDDDNVSIYNTHIARITNI